MKTISEFKEFSIKEKGSLFKSMAYPVASEEEFNPILANIKKRDYDATHHCYAYKLMNGIFKFSDDGEPSGTAGKRILNAIVHFELYGVAVIVVRYFGGTKLGVGPLGKVYYNAAFHVLKLCNQVELVPHKRVRIIFPYHFISTIHRYLERANARISDTDYHGEKTIVSCLLTEPALENLQSTLPELSGGEIQLVVEPESVYI